MGDKELYQQKLQAQLDQWKAEIIKLKAKASAASADVQLEMNKHIAALEGKLEESRTKLADLAAAGEDAWEAMKESVEYLWGTLKSTVDDAVSRFKS